MTMTTSNQIGLRYLKWPIFRQSSKERPMSNTNGLVNDPEMDWIRLRRPNTKFSRTFSRFNAMKLIENKYKLQDTRTRTRTFSRTFVNKPPKPPHFVMKFKFNAMKLIENEFKLPDTRTLISSKRPIDSTMLMLMSSTLHLVNDINDINSSSFLPEMARPRLRPNSGGGGAP